MIQLQAGVSQLNSQAQVALSGATNALGKLMGGLDQIHAALQDQITPAGQQIATGVSTLQGKMAQGSNQLVDGVATKLRDGASQLIDGSNTLTEDINTLATSLQDASDQLSLVSVSDENAQAVSQPVKTKKTDRDKVATNGVGLAPYMMAVSLMVVAISTNVIFAKSLDGKNFANRWDWAKSKLLVNGSIATAAAILLYGAVRLIGLVPAHPAATFGFTLLIAWTLMALVTALIGWNSRYGSFVAMILLLLQLGSSAGTYPIQLSPGFFGNIQPFLPVSYAVSGLRQTISLSGAIGSQVVALLIFFLLFCGFGLLVFRSEAE